MNTISVRFMFLLYRFSLVIVLALVMPAQALAVISVERNALLDLYHATDGANWKNKSNWLTTGVSECNWYGVTCNDDGNIEQLLLPFNRLNGNIPATLGKLQHLRNLYLNSNQDLGGQIPEELGQLVNLEKLSLHSNQLTGSIPLTLGTLSKLQGLWLYNNQLSGEIPPTLIYLNQVRNLRIEDNQCLYTSVQKLIDFLQPLSPNWVNCSAGQQPTGNGQNNTSSDICDARLSGDQLQGFWWAVIVIDI